MSREYSDTNVGEGHAYDTHEDRYIEKLEKQIVTLRAQLSSLTATNAGLLRDKERLDWLEATLLTKPTQSDGRKWLKWDANKHPSLRSAIDAAAALTPPTSPATEPPCT